ncbi:MAG: hypothetical protein NTY45_06505 [Elusimicrobia bacterium]|nr:hypothetical protein [Elusimicrobiota bacterium]
MNNFLSNFALDRWYKILIWLGLFLLVIAFLGFAKWFTNADTGILGFSLLFIGLGEWKTQKIKIQETEGGILKLPTRDVDFISVVLWGAGLTLLIKFLLKTL